MTYRRNSYPRVRAKFLLLATFDLSKGRFDHLDYEKSNLHEHHKFLYQRISSRIFPFLELDIRILDIFPFLKEVRLRTICVMLEGLRRRNYHKRRSFHFSIRVYPFWQNLYGFQNYLESLLPNFLHLKSVHQNSHQPKSVSQIQFLKVPEKISEDIPLTNRY